MDEVNKASTMSSVKEYPRKRRIFTKKFFTEELKDAGALKIKTVNGVEQMALKKVSSMTVGLVVAAKGTKSFPDSVIVKWIRPGSKLTQLMEQQFLMYDQLVKFLGGGVHQDDIEKWKNLLRTSKYIWPEENDGWSSIFGNETFLSFKIIPVKLLAKGFCSKEWDSRISSDIKAMPIPDKSLDHFIKQAENLSKSDNQNKDELIAKESHCSDSKQSHRRGSKESHRSGSKELHCSDSKQSHRSSSKESHRSGSKESHCSGSKESHCSDSKQSHRSGSKESHRSGSKELHCSYSKESHCSDSKHSHRSDSKQSHCIDSKQSHHSELQEVYHCDSDIENREIASIIVKKKDEVAKESVCKLDKEDIMDDQKEYSEEILYKSVNDAAEISNSGNNIFRDSKENSLQRLSIEYTDLVETDNAKESNNMNISENVSKNNENPLDVFEVEDIIGKSDENISKKIFSDRKESLTNRYEESCFEESMVEKSTIGQYEEYSPKTDINDVNIDEERKILKKDIHIGKIENMEVESVPQSKPLSEIIIKKKRKKRVIQDDNISDINYKSYRIVILPEEDVQCSFCERITHTIDNCPDRKRIKTLQNKTVWDRISVKKRTRPECLNVQNINSTFSVLKCATGSKYLYKSKAEKNIDNIKSSNNNDYYAKPHVKINPNAVKPFISNKWHKPSNNTISMKCDVDKKKKELLSKQIKELKELLNLFTNKKSDMSLEVKKTLLETIKSLQTSIDNIRQQLKNKLDKKQSTNVGSVIVSYKEKKEERAHNTKVQHMGNESEKGKFSPSPESLHDKSNMQVQNLQKESENEKNEELKDDYLLSPSLRQKNEDKYLPNLLPSPERLLDKSNLLINHLENEPEKEKYEELKYGMLSPSLRQKSEDEYSLKLVLSPERLLDKSPAKTMNNSNNTAE